MIALVMLVEGKGVIYCKPSFFKLIEGQMPFTSSKIKRGREAIEVNGTKWLQHLVKTFQPAFLQLTVEHSACNTEFMGLIPIGNVFIECIY